VFPNTFMPAFLTEFLQHKLSVIQSMRYEGETFEANLDIQGRFHDGTLITWYGGYAPNPQWMPESKNTNKPSDCSSMCIL
jgi:hypothetical protein